VPRRLFISVLRQQKAYRQPILIHGAVIQPRW
jgi:hypothetical protein